MPSASPLWRDTIWYHAFGSIVTAYAEDSVTTTAETATTAPATASANARRTLLIRSLLTCDTPKVGLGLSMLAFTWLTAGTVLHR
ncbi:hypothetical protein GCM10023170_054990 [Phytohabitans houttuyneae]|uniref:Uncharacterized protein n=1 Tax=Phytohabitans houttuyneae TaxID=1076126 RepID=A0A6V8KAD8_9ACTN|nr:hypothetical protein Phou_063830 [Phytohabitans houttuyneae]